MLQAVSDIRSPRIKELSTVYIPPSTPQTIRAVPVQKNVASSAFIVLYITAFNKSNTRVFLIFPVMPTLSDLHNLVLLPNETLSNEYKSWLDLSSTSAKATLAKAAIALANHGGGVIVMGMAGPTGSPLRSLPRPDSIERYDPDIINAAVNRYADPKIHCDVHFILHPVTNVEHAIISVPGLSVVPIMSIRDCDGVLLKHRCYIRKPGPKSEEPFTSEEWRAILSRCVQAGRETMLDSIRIILQGHSVDPIVQDTINPLREFAKESKERWVTLKKILPVDDPAHIPLGHYEFAFRILDVFPVSLAKLKKRLNKASQTKHTGWGPFVDIGRTPIRPVPTGNAIEAWIGHPDEKERNGQHADFWRAHIDGRLFLLRSFDEDFLGVEPGTAIDFALPIWRLGESLLYVSRFAFEWGFNPKILVRAEYVGLNGRILRSISKSHIPVYERKSHTDTVALEGQTSAIEIDENLTEVLHSFLPAFYEIFDFYKLPKELVTHEVEQLRSGKF